MILRFLKSKTTWGCAIFLAAQYVAYLETQGWFFRNTILQLHDIIEVTGIWIAAYGARNTKSKGK